MWSPQRAAHTSPVRRLRVMGGAMCALKAYRTLWVLIRRNALR